MTEFREITVVYLLPVIKKPILIKANTIASTIVVLQLLSDVPLLQKSDTVTAINREMIIKDYY